MLGEVVLISDPSRSSRMFATPGVLESDALLMPSAWQTDAIYDP